MGFSLYRVCLTTSLNLKRKVRKVWWWIWIRDENRPCHVGCAKINVVKRKSTKKTITNMFDRYLKWRVSWTWNFRIFWGWGNSLTYNLYIGEDSSILGTVRNVWWNELRAGCGITVFTDIQCIHVKFQSDGPPPPTTRFYTRNIIDIIGIP